MNPDAFRHLISFDVEEYFQVEAAAARVPIESWDGRPQRAGTAVETVLDLLDEHRTRATFFVLGWIAERRPDLVRRIAAAGHEIASHGSSHRMIGRMSPDEFLADVRDARRLLQDISGQDVTGYRAPTFSVTRPTSWALSVLLEAGYRYDSSIFPVRHDRYGVPDAPRVPHRAVAPEGLAILEIPPLTWRILGRNVPMGGGGYLRLFPVRWIGRALRTAGARGVPGMIYLHPWELDPDQPVLPMSRLSRWRHRVGLKRTAGKLRWLLNRFRFDCVRDRLDEIESQARETFDYSPIRGG